MKNVYQSVTKLFQSVEAAVAVANRLDKAYAEGVGHPEYHTPFDVTNSQMVAMNLAGLYAADTYANLFVIGCSDTGSAEDEYITVLETLAAGDLSRAEKQFAKNLTNLAWRSGQPFRDLATNPLNRITREVNMQFNLLSPDEEDKDLIQIQEGARILLEWIKQHQA